MVLTPVDDEIRDCWFLVYDADADDHARTLLAVEVSPGSTEGSGRPTPTSPTPCVTASRRTIRRCSEAKPPNLSTDIGVVCRANSRSRSSGSTIGRAVTTA
jgi:hypothetical protein